MTSMYQRGDVIVGIVSKANDRSDGGTGTGTALRASRRARRFGWISRQRLSVLLMVIGAICFVCVTFFSIKVHFHGEKEIDRNISKEQSSFSVRDGLLVINNTLESISSIDIEDKVAEINPPPKRRSRKHYPCDIEFAKSVEYILEPKDYINFTRFKLDYVDKEDKAVIKSPSDLRFGGHQSLEEREKSFHAGDKTLHCGFVKGPDGIGGSGFKLDDKDTKYMQSCVIIVSSCIFGSSDFLRRPTSKLISDYSKRNVCFVMFLDEQTLIKLSAEGNVPDERGRMGLWRIVIVRNLPYEDMRRNGKVPKLLAHRLFPSSRYSIWLDSKMRLNADPLLILEHFLWRTRSEYAISKHYDRQCLWEEVLQNKRLNKYNHTAIDEQFMFYRSDGLTKFDVSDPHKLLPSYVPEGSFIIRAHTPMSNLFSCLWFNEVDRFTSRDQLSFAYTYLKLKRTNSRRPFFLHMFKDCERRALVKLFHHRDDSSLPAPP
ncbi:putative hexosyltransferase MUCI70 [Silene latifolia]|uniref:putative hexosyltransferase MUCI70 n=1 Tax=Silene latifolia TaxID=37657 RepID=UPI003D774A5E